MSKDKIRVVELFAGVGGFRIGLEKSSSIFNTVWANQWEPGQKDNGHTNAILKILATLRYVQMKISQW